MRIQRRGFLAVKMAITLGTALCPLLGWSKASRPNSNIKIQKNGFRKLPIPKIDHRTGDGHSENLAVPQKFHILKTTVLLDCPPQSREHDNSQVDLTSGIVGGWFPALSEHPPQFHKTHYPDKQLLGLNI